MRIVGSTGLSTQAHAAEKRMPIATPKAKTTPTRARKAMPARKATPPRQPAFQEPLMAAPDSDRPQDHKGIPVVREELLKNLPKSPFKISRLHLSDGTTAFACRDCLVTADTRGEVATHRNAEHGSRYGKPTPRVKFVADKQSPDLVLPARGDQPAPTDPMKMTIGEFLALLPDVAALNDLVESSEVESERLRDELRQRSKDQHKIDVYDSLQDEVVSLRLLVRNTGSYEELKREVVELRAWKKKMIQRLSALGFNFTEEEEEQ